MTDFASVKNYFFEYSRFTTLIAAHDCFYICRYFFHLRACLFLSKQDNLILLKTQLKNINCQKNAFFFEVSWLNCDIKQKAIFSKINVVLIDYDKSFRFKQFINSFTSKKKDALIARNYHILNFNTVREQDVLNLQNWINDNVCLIRIKTAYLLHNEDLLSVI